MRQRFEKLTERIKSFRKTEALFMIAIVLMFLAGLVYCASSDNRNFEKVAQELQGRLNASGEIGIKIAVPEGLVYKMETLLPGEEILPTPQGVNPLVSARELGCTYLLTEFELGEEELKMAGYEKIYKKSSYRLYRKK